MSTQQSKLLKEVIADAKAVKATALANAKAVLEEAFNSRFSAVFADKLREDSSLETSTEPQVEQPPVAESTEKDVVGSTKPSGDKNDVNWGKNGDPAAKPTVKNITPNTVPAAKDGGDATKSLSKDNKGNAMDGTPQGVKENIEDNVDDVSPTNEDLEEIIRELELEAGDVPSDTPPVSGDGSSTPAPGGDATSDPVPDAEPPTGEGEPLKSGDTITISKVEEPTPSTPDASVDAAADNSAPPPSEPPQLEEEEIDLNELLASLNEESKENEKEDEKDEKEEKEEVDEALNSKLNEVIAERDEAIKAVQYLKSQINEINLLNAKLLYTNKLFKEFGMTKDQKHKIVEAFDLTKNVREVKMTYANWCESLNFGGKAQRRVQPSVVTTITEGSASKTVASTKPAKPIITESFGEQARRFQKLAGISVKK